MKFRDFIVEEKEKTTVFAFGRMNPGPTTGHEKLINTVKSLSKEHKADHLIVMSHSQDPKKNPLSPEQKLKHAKRFFPKINFKTSSKQSPSFLTHAAELHNSGTKHLVMVGGSDRAEEYHKTLHKYNGEGEGKLFNFKSIKVVSSGERDPDAEGAEGMSASKMRAHASSNNFKEFRKGVPSHVSDVHARELFHDTQTGMKSAPKSVREQYLNGEIFTLGNIVYFDESEGTIINCGKNYVVVESETGVDKKWISDITETKPLPIVDLEEGTEIKRFTHFKNSVEREIPRLLMTRKQIEEYNEKLQNRNNVSEDLRNWFDSKHPKGGWKRINTKGEVVGPCAREEGEPKPKCMSNEKIASLSKSERAAAVRAKRKHDPNPERKGDPINVSNYGKGKIGEEVEQIEEKNVPTNPELWSRAKTLAKSKFDIYPSAYANGWASKWYKSKGGGWKTVSESLLEDYKQWSNDEPVKYAKHLEKFFGKPDEFTNYRVVWYNKDGFKRIEIHDEYILHASPAPHYDFCYCYIDLKIPHELAKPLAESSESIMIDFLKNEVGARCASLSANAVTLNYCLDVVANRVKPSKKEYERRIKEMQNMFSTGKKYQLDWWPDVSKDTDPKNKYYMTEKYDDNSEEDIDENDLNWEDIEDTYESEDFISEEILDEKISASARLRKRMQFARTSTRRQTAAAIKLRRPSTQAQLQKRATVAARRMLLKKLLHGRDKASMSAQEKDMIEQRLKQMSKIQSTLATRLVPRIKELERKRLKTK